MRMASPGDEFAALWAQIAALTARVYQLEQTIGAGSARREPAVPEARMPAPVPPPPGEFRQVPPKEESSAARPTLQTPARETMFHAASAGEGASLEKKIGQYWLNRIGIVAMLIGVSYFLKYAFDNNWIGPSGRVGIGMLTGIGLVLWGERFRKQGHKAFSYSLKAVGIGTLYLSLWGAYQLYHLIPAAAAFAAMAVVTGATIALALAEDAEVLASIALVGGFATPVLLSTGENHEVVLFSYVGLLDLGILVLAMRKPWRRLLWGSFAGTMILYAGWNARYFSQEQRPVTVLFAALFAAIFAAIPLVTPLDRSTRFPGPSMTLTYLPLLNAGVFFLALFDMYRRETVTLTWYALALAAVYLGIGSLFKRRFPEQDTQFINLLHVAIAIAFITIAIPLKLNAQWITIGWLIESAVLLWISVKIEIAFLRYLAVAALMLGIVRLLVYDRIHTETLVFNARFATYAVAVAVLGGIVHFGERHASDVERPLLSAALVVLNLLALIALTLEASDYFDRALTASNRFRPDNSSYAQLRLARDFSYSAIWLIYGAALMAIGFWRRSALVRWQSLLLIAVTIAKVFLYDVSALDRGYRILSFVALGAVLLAISFVYQKDWLKLAAQSSEKDTEARS